MLDAGVSLAKVAKIVGWSAGTMSAMAKRYGHFQLEELRAAVELITETDSGNVGFPEFASKNLPKKVVMVNTPSLLSD